MGCLKINYFIAIKIILTKYEKIQPIFLILFYTADLKP